MTDIDAAPVRLRLTEEADRADLRSLTRAAVIECLATLRSLHDGGHAFEKSTYPVRKNPKDTYGRIEWSSSGDVPFSYKSAIGLPGSYRAKVSIDDLDSIQRLIAFVDAHPDLDSWLSPESIDDSHLQERFRLMHVADLPLEIANRHIHESGWHLEMATFERLFSEMEAWWLQETLPVDLVVPILGVDFEVEDARLDDTTRLNRLDEKLRLALWPGHHLGAREALVGMATHAVINSGWTVANESAFRWMRPSQPPEVVPAAEQFLKALAVFADEPSGYVQAAMIPVGWSPGYVADLPVVLTGPLLDDRSSARLKASREPGTKLDQRQVEKLCDAYRLLGRQQDISLAASRLLSAERRSARSDRIVDLCVGLEALLSDSQGETTYKIAVRATAMLAEAGVPNCADFLPAMKTVYAFRSSVVHGRSSEKTATVKLGDDTFGTESVAQFVLRSLLETRFRRPTLTPNQIDGAIIGTALAVYGGRALDEPPTRQAGQG